MVDLMKIADKVEVPPGRSAIGTEVIARRNLAKDSERVRTQVSKFNRNLPHDQKNILNSNNETMISEAVGIGSQKPSLQPQKDGESESAILQVGLIKRKKGRQQAKDRVALSREAVPPIENGKGSWKKATRTLRDRPTA